MKYGSFKRGPRAFFFGVAALTLCVTSLPTDSGRASAQPVDPMHSLYPSLHTYVQGRVYAGEELPPDADREDPEFDILGDREVLGPPDLYPVAPMNMVLVNLLRADDGTVIDTTNVVDGGAYVVHSAFPIDRTRTFRLEVRDLMTDDLLFLSDPVTFAAGVSVLYLVVPGEPLEMGPVETLSTDLVEFSRVGFIEIDPYIDVNGFATVDPVHAQDLLIPAFTDAPFGGNLRIFGTFRHDKHPTNVASMRSDYCYTIKIGSEPMTRELKKTRMSYAATGEPVSETIVMGPFNAWWPIHGINVKCYALTPIESGASWTFGNLLALWPSRQTADGPTEVTVQLYELYNGTVVDVIGDDTLTLHVHNQRPEVQIDDVFVGTKISNRWRRISGSCEIVDLTDGSLLKLVYTAQDPNLFAGPEDFLYEKQLWKLSNNGRRVELLSDTADTVYSGSPIGVASEPLVVPWSRDESCTYIFRVYAKSRTTDGYSRIYWRYDEEAFYVRLPSI